MEKSGTVWSSKILKIVVTPVVSVGSFKLFGRVEVNRLKAELEAERKRQSRGAGRRQLTDEVGDVVRSPAAPNGPNTKAACS